MTKMLMHSGHTFDLAEPERGPILAEDIAHHLAQICRFNGATRGIYTVAQHSVHVSEIVPEQYQLAGLLHDAAEAYTGDITSPMKELLGQTYRNVYRRIEAAIAARFRIPPAYIHSDIIKYADMVLLATEKEQLLPKSDVPWPCLDGIEPMNVQLPVWPPGQAKMEFLQRLTKLLNMER